MFMSLTSKTKKKFMKWKFIKKTIWTKLLIDDEFLGAAATIWSSKTSAEKLTGIVRGKNTKTLKVALK